MLPLNTRPGVLRSPLDLRMVIYLGTGCGRFSSVTWGGGRVELRALLHRSSSQYPGWRSLMCQTDATGPPHPSCLNRIPSTCLE